MSVSTSANRNFLSPLGYKFTLARAPQLSYHVQSVSFPGIELGFAEQATPFVKMPLPSKINYNSLGITFRVSEDMDDYLEIFNWMIGLGAPKSFSQYKAIAESPTGAKEKLTSDLNLVILNSAMRPNVEINFYDGFPISLSNIEFNTMDTQVNYVEATVEFKYLRHEINRL